MLFITINVLNKIFFRWNYPTLNDFGSEIIPAAVKEHNVHVKNLFVYFFH